MYPLDGGAICIHFRGALLVALRKKCERRAKVSCKYQYIFWQPTFRDISLFSGRTEVT